MSNIPTDVYYGTHDAMVAEVSAWSPRTIKVPKRECAWLVMPYGDAQFDTEWFQTARGAKEYAEYIAGQFANCKPHRVP